MGQSDTVSTTTAGAIWVNGALRETDEASVSVMDHGLTVGDGVFETLKATGGTAFAMDRHLRRLARSARGLGLPEPDLDEVRHACEAVLAANPAPHGRLRVTYTGGTSPLGSERGTTGPTLVVALGAASVRPDTTAVVTVPWTRNEKGALAGLKTTSYGENVVALARAHQHGASEALFANTQGRPARAPAPTSSSSSGASCSRRRSPPDASPGSPASSSSSGPAPTRPTCPSRPSPRRRRSS